MSRRKGSKQLILDFFLSNLGKVVESREIQLASGGAVEWARRVRELRNEEGYQILSHKDRADLKPNQYLLETDKRLPANIGLPKPDRIHLLAQVRRATIDDQKALLEWLLKKFHTKTTDKNLLSD